MRVPTLLVLLAVLTAGCTLPGPTMAPVTYPTEVVGNEWPTLVIEIDHAPGYRPSETALTHLEMTMRNITRKTDITLLVQESLPAEPRTWTADDLLALERDTRTTQHAAPVALVHVLYPAGKYENPDAAGIAIGGVTLGPAVIFLDVLRELRLPLAGLPALQQPQPALDRLERSTLLHEVGHAIGLVNNGMPMTRPHEDAEHERHSNNQNSVMYWAIESSAGLRDHLLNDKSIPDTFDADDRADIRAAGGK